MTLPTSFAPLINSIETLLLSGSGVAPYTIPSQFYAMDYFSENRELQALSQDTLIKPSLRVKITDFDTEDGPMQPTSVYKYNTSISIELAWHLDAATLKVNRTKIETAIPSAVVVIQKAIQFPQNLQFDSYGNETGLSSGRLTFQKYTNIKYDYTMQVATANIYFEGIVWMSNA